MGADDLGEMLLKHLNDVGVVRLNILLKSLYYNRTVCMFLLFNFVLQSTFGVQVNKKRSTATYSVVLNSKGEVIIGIGDMDIHKSITTSLV